MTGWPLRKIALPGKPSVRRVQKNVERTAFAVLHAAVSAPAKTISILDREYAITGSHEFESEIQDLAFTRDNSRIAFCTLDGEIGQISLDDSSTSIAKVSNDRLFGMASMSDSLVAVGGYEVLIFDTSSESIVSRITKQQLKEAGFLFCRDIVFDPETNKLFVNAIGKRLGVPEAEPYSAILVVSTGDSPEVESTIRFRRRIECLGQNEKGSVFVGTDDGRMHVLNCHTLEQTQFPDTYGTSFCIDVYDGKLYWGTQQGRIQESAEYAPRGYHQNDSDERSTCHI